MPPKNSLLADARAEKDTPPSPPPAPVNPPAPPLTAPPPAPQTPAPAGRRAIPEDVLKAPPAGSPNSPAPPPAPPAPLAPPPSEEEPGHIDETKIPEDTRKNFGLLRKKAERLEAENRTLRETVSKAGQGSPREKELEGQVNLLQDKVAMLSLSEDPRFQAKFEPRKKAVLDQAKDLVKQYGAGDDIIDTALTLPLKERTAFLADQIPELKGVLLQKLVDYDTIEAERRGELQNWKQTLADRQKEDQKGQEAAARQRDQIRAQLHAETVATLAAEGYFLFQESAADPEWNKGVQALKQSVLDVYSTTDHKVLAKTLALGNAAPLLLKMFQEERAARLELENTNRRRGAIRPGNMGNGSPPAPPAEGPKAGESSRFLADKYFGK